MRFHLVFLLVFSCSSSKMAFGQGVVYYVDSVMGDDAASGTRPNSPWKSLEKVNSTIFEPGAQIRFRSGQAWTGQLVPQGSGAEGKPIVIGKYGVGAAPQIHGRGVGATVVLHNQSYWEIHDLEITNYNAEEENGLSLEQWEAKNISDYTDVELPAKAVKNNTPKLGVKITGEDRGEIRHIHLKNLLVHGVNGTIVPDGADENGVSKHNGGIGLEILGDKVPTWFEDVQIEGCVIRDVDRTGVFNRSSWDKRTLHENDNWVPSKNIVIRKNIFQRTGANALIVRVADRPLIEHNLFDYCAIKGSGNAAFSFNTDSAIWQYNECRFTKANIGDNDAGGIDSDYRSKRTLIQYNWLHDNDFGMLVTGGGGSFNDGTVVRYNIIERDGRMEHRGDRKKFVFKVSGGATNTSIYNNTIYTDESQDSTFLVFHKLWKVWPEQTAYYNNFFINNDTHAAVSMGGSTGNTFGSNLIQGFKVPELDNLREAEIKVLLPGNGPEGYRPQLSPVVRGKRLPDNGGQDYFGQVPGSGASSAVGAVYYKR